MMNSVDTTKLMLPSGDSFIKMRRRSASDASSIPDRSPQVQDFSAVDFSTILASQSSQLPRTGVRRSSSDGAEPVASLFSPWITAPPKRNKASGRTLDYGAKDLSRLARAELERIARLDHLSGPQKNRCRPKHDVNEWTNLVLGWTSDNDHHVMPAPSSKRSTQKCTLTKPRSTTMMMMTEEPTTQTLPKNFEGKSLQQKRKCCCSCKAPKAALRLLRGVCSSGICCMTGFTRKKQLHRVEPQEATGEDEDPQNVRPITIGASRTGQNEPDANPPCEEKLTSCCPVADQNGRPGASVIKVTWQKLEPEDLSR